MNVALARIGVRFGLSLCLLGAMPPREANAQLSGLFQSMPGNLAAYQYQANGIETEMLPVDLTLIFSNDNPTSMLTATIFNPIIGAQADGTPIYPIAGYFPMRVVGTSQNGEDFHGDLLGTQYLFDWQIKPANEGKLMLNGSVYWAGGRIELTTIRDAFLIPAVAGDYNRDGTVDAADYVVWRDNLGSVASLPNDDTPGVGPDDYDRWKTNFGQSAGSGSGASANTAVPEPATLLMMILAVTGWCLRQGRLD